MVPLTYENKQPKKKKKTKNKEKTGCCCMDDLPLATAHADAWPANGSSGLYFSLSRCPSQRFSQTPQILYCGCQQELFVRTAYAPLALAVQLLIALEMGNQHFHILPVPARI